MSEGLQSYMDRKWQERCAPGMTDEFVKELLAVAAFAKLHGVTGGDILDAIACLTARTFGEA